MKTQLHPFGNRIPWAIALLLLLQNAWLFSAQTRVRSDVNFPDIPGYVTLKCDFHMHTAGPCGKG